MISTRSPQFQIPLWPLAALVDLFLGSPEFKSSATLVGTLHWSVSPHQLGFLLVMFSLVFLSEQPFVYTAPQVYGFINKGLSSIYHV